jgi:pSer/pThr/pTyr-binding forkhead associated (FHA) protein
MAVGRNYELTTSTVFGREPELAQLAIKDGWISSRHFQIDFTGDAAYLTDLESKHGTFLNGNRVHQRVRLNSEDLIKAGKTTLRFRTISEMVPKSPFDSTDSPAIISVSENFDSVTTLNPQDRPHLPDRPTDPDLEEAVHSKPVTTTPKQPSIPRKTVSKPTIPPSDPRPKNATPSSHPVARRDDNRHSVKDQPVDSSGNDFQSPDSIPWTPPENSSFADMPFIVSDSSEGEMLEVDLDQPVAEERSGSLHDSPQVPLEASNFEALPTSSDAEPSVPQLEYEESRGTSDHSTQPELEEHLADNQSLTGISLESLTDVASEQLQSALWHATSSSLPQGADLAGFLSCIHKLLPLQAVVHFQRMGQTTPLSLVCAVPLIDWLPEPIARAYGPIECDLHSLLNAVTPDELRRLWLANALCFFGGKKSELIDGQLRSLCATTKQGNHRSSELPAWNLSTVRMILETHSTEQIEKIFPAKIFECVIMPALFDPKGWTLYSPYPFDSLLHRDKA